ncbi:MAG TPA: FkbM family methyltransferase [Drouetiella sp.]
MSTGFVERIKGVKDRVLFYLEEIKKDGEHLAKIQEDNHQDVRSALSILNAQMHDLAAESKRIEQQHHDDLRKIIRPAFDEFSYPPDLEDYRRHNPEISLLQYLRAYLPSPNVVDIGANIGLVSELLLSAGYRVFAFEPMPQAYHDLCQRFDGVSSGFKAFQIAVGPKDCSADFYSVELENSDLAKSLDKDLSVYSTTVQHAVPAGLKYSDPIEVKMRSMRSLHASGEIPADVAIVKIDTEGGDLEVIRGMNNPKYPVIMSEFWDAEHYFSNGQFGLLNETVAQLRGRGYGWHIVIYRKLGENSGEPRFYCNIDQSVKQSWGNVLFFRDYELFREALKWCNAMIRPNNPYGA